MKLEALVLLFCVVGLSTQRGLGRHRTKELKNRERFDHTKKLGPTIRNAKATRRLSSANQNPTVVVNGPTNPNGGNTNGASGANSYANQGFLSQQQNDLANKIFTTPKVKLFDALGQVPNKLKNAILAAIPVNVLAKNPTLNKDVFIQLIQAVSKSGITPSGNTPASSSGSSGSYSSGQEPSMQYAQPVPIPYSPPPPPPVSYSPPPPPPPPSIPFFPFPQPLPPITFLPPPPMPFFPLPPPPMSYSPAPAPYSPPQQQPAPYSPPQQQSASYSPPKQRPAPYSPPQQQPAPYSPPQQQPAPYSPPQQQPASYSPPQQASYSPASSPYSSMMLSNQAHRASRAKKWRKTTDQV